MVRMKKEDLHVTMLNGNIGSVLKASNPEICFALGRCYRHTTGLDMKIIGTADSTLYGIGFVSETADGSYSIVGRRVENAIGWVEISNELWMANFNEERT